MAIVSFRYLLVCHPVFCHNRTEKKVPFLSNFINSVAEIVAFFIFLCVKDMILQFCSFPGVDICPKLPHPVLSRHRHNRSLFYQSPNISSLHRQTGSFQVIRQKTLGIFLFQIQLFKLLQTYFYKRGGISWPHMDSDAPSPKHSHLLVRPCRAYSLWNYLQISEETYNNITRLVLKN